MGFAFSESEIIIVTSGVITVAAVLLAIIYSVRKQRALTTDTDSSCQTQDKASAKNKSNEESAEKSGMNAHDGVDWNTKDPEEIARILSSMGGGSCPILHGLPHFSKIGGTWPPDKKDIIDPVEQLMSSSSNRGDAGAIDPKDFCDHIPSSVKRTQQRVAMQKMQEKMNEDDKEHEREVQRQQLEAIYKLMETEKDKFGVDNMDDIQNQMNLYVQ